MTDRVTSTDIDDAYVASRRADVFAEELDGETVIWDGRGGSLHVLNQTATIVWQRLDGAASVGQVARDLSDAFGVETARMTTDVLEAVRSFSNQGLLNGVQGPGEPHEGKTQPAKGSDASASQEPNHRPRFLPQPPGG